MKPAPPMTRRCRPESSNPPVTSPCRASNRRDQPAFALCLRCELCRTEQRRHRSRVGPMTLVDPCEKAALVDEVIQDIGDLELATSRHVERFDDRKGAGP